MMDFDRDGVLKAQDLERAIQLVGNKDCTFGQEVQLLIDHYSQTHLRKREKPLLQDAITLQKFIELLAKRETDRRQQAAGPKVWIPKIYEVESSLLNELTKKMLGKEGQYKKESVFVCTEAEVVQALKYKHRFSGLAKSVIAGGDH